MNNEAIYRAMIYTAIAGYISAIKNPLNVNNTEVYKVK